MLSGVRGKQLGGCRCFWKGVASFERAIRDRFGDEPWSVGMGCGLGDDTWGAEVGCGGEECSSRGAPGHEVRESHPVSGGPVGINLDPSACVLALSLIPPP